MRLCTCMIACCLLTVEATAPAAVKVTNPKTLLPASRIIQPRRRAAFSARLSPHGQYLLFPQEVQGQRETYRLVLLNIDSKEEFEVPLDLPRGYETVFTRFNFFSPAGDTLALFSVEREPSGMTTSEIMLLDIPSKRLTATGIKGPSVMAQFDSSAKQLVVRHSGERVCLAPLDRLTLGDTILSGWVHSCSPYSPYAAVFTMDRQRRQTGLSILNLRTKEAQSVPVHPDNSILDDVTSQWTSDGRYVCYVDLQDHDGGRRFDVTRVWDVESNQEVTPVPGVRPIGPGPADHLIVMMATRGQSRGKTLVYDLKTGAISPLGPPSMKTVHAWKNHIVYVAPEGQEDRVYIAEITMTDREGT